ncbi:uncharacterized protein N7498_009276 [Penicillium cinerascens]|uniref:Uncharacterized protein n=1 Tax=Penicillium cinerascens TaxID=70096 RepID=A0A9W9J9P7_9EURO|nr:uncharacterized protein N7498_009276 [Penicillium cinerascens]KAJ5190291.1 hypothetical protein N7498_009276 [Penicillium cinerascens]
MAHRDPSPVHVPLRTSSRNLLRSSAMESNKEVSMADRRTSKAHRILGTELPLPNGRWDKPQKPRRSSLRTPDDSSRQQRSSFLPFPSGEAVPPQNLRVRASSPLLGYDYRSNDPAPPLPKPSKKVHPSGSSSTLFSYFSSKEKDSASKSVKSGKSGKSAKSTPTTPNHTSLQPRVRHELQAHPSVTYQHQPAQTPPKESKRKLRPPRIDLSILFPKPRNPAPSHLLSPQRVTRSPSPVSTVASDWPSNRVDRLGSNSTARKLQVGEPLSQRTSTIQKEAPNPRNDRSDLLSIPEMKDREGSPRSWGNPLERTVGTSEIDLALDRYAGRRSLFSRSSVYTTSREQLQPEQQCFKETIQQRRGHSPASGQSKDLYLSPTPKPDEGRGQSRNRTNSNTHSTNTTVSKKSSKSTLKNKDLQQSSVLCLSSSEDEDSDQDVTPTEKVTKNKNFRDSVATYGDFEPEIHTASTAQATVGTPTLKRVERAPSTSSRGSSQIPPFPQPQPRRHTSNSSSSKPPAATQRKSSQPHRTSGVPTIAEPDILSKFPQQRLRTPQELKEMNRRSRVIAVTRQEQDLLEAMRVRKGKITPSIFHNNGAAQPDRSSMISGPSRDSFCGSDTSFLRLSAAFPPFNTQTEQGASSHMDKYGSSSQSSGSDTEQKTGNSIASPRFSLGYSESLPSPATSGASPLTPTLPIHRFSPLPSQKPPPRGPPPAIPEDQKQHTRRRTDSSEAIMLNENGEQRKHDLPLWSFDFDWNQDLASVAAVH